MMTISDVFDALTAADRPYKKALSAERVWSEIKRILQAPDPVPALRLMLQTGVLALVLPEADLARLGAMRAAGAPADALLSLAALGCGDVAAFAARWRLSGAEAERLAVLVVPNVLRPEDDDLALRRELADNTADVLVDRIAILTSQAVAGGQGSAPNPRAMSSITGSRRMRSALRVNSTA